MITVTRLMDNVQCKVCGWEGGSRGPSAACPRCRTEYHDRAPQVASEYCDTQDAVLAAVERVRETHEIAVVRKVDGQAGLFHVGGLRSSFQADHILSNIRPASSPGDVLFLSYADFGHQLLRINPVGGSRRHGGYERELKVLLDR